MDVVAITKRLTPEMVLQAYPQGLFPMFTPSLQAVTWHCPERRAILPLDRLHVPRRLDRTMRQGHFEVTFDQAFAHVMKGCAEGRPVWISDEFREVYGELHRRGFAHSVEVWDVAPAGTRTLVGGAYGVHIGGAFFAESKFHRARDASKVALTALARRLRDSGFDLLEVQYVTDHLRQFGVIEVAHNDYMKLLSRAIEHPRDFGTVAQS